jgi:hypothetical protein
MSPARDHLLVTGVNPASKLLLDLLDRGQVSMDGDWVDW